MIKTKIIETTEKYDKDGKLVEKIIREESTEDDETRYPATSPAYPYVFPGVPNPNTSGKQWCKDPYYFSVTCNTNAAASEGKVILH